jgi:hypothetical protein
MKHKSFFGKVLWIAVAIFALGLGTAEAQTFLLPILLDPLFCQTELLPDLVRYPMPNQGLVGH